MDGMPFNRCKLRHTAARMRWSGGNILCAANADITRLDFACNPEVCFFPGIVVLLEPVWGSFRTTCTHIKLSDSQVSTNVWEPRTMVKVVDGIARRPNPIRQNFALYVSLYLWQVNVWLCVLYAALTL